MSGLDYCSCQICGRRLFYDGDMAARGYMASCETADFWEKVCLRFYC